MSCTRLGGSSSFPQGITFNYLSPEGERTGTAVLSGDPAEAVIGQHSVQIGVTNGYHSSDTGMYVFPFKLHVTKAGDVNQDGVVNCHDYNLVASALGGLRGTDNYNFRADTNNDGFVNEVDRQFVLQRVQDFSCAGAPPTMTLTANPGGGPPGWPITFGGTLVPGSPIDFTVSEKQLLVECDLSPIGGPNNAQYAGISATWTISATVGQSTSPGTKNIVCRVRDKWNRMTQKITQVLIGDNCGSPKTLISAIQSVGSATTMAGETVEVEGVVSAAFQGTRKLNGYFIQDVPGDGNWLTSDGIFIDESASSRGQVQPGQKVRVRGIVAEKDNMTVIGNVSAQLACGLAPALVAPVDVTFPLMSTDVLERFEGMLVRIPQPLYVTDTSNLGRFNEVGLAAPPQTLMGQTLTRLYAPTQVTI